MFHNSYSCSFRVEYVDRCSLFFGRPSTFLAFPIHCRSHGGQPCVCDFRQEAHQDYFGISSHALLALDDRLGICDSSRISIVESSVGSTKSKPSRIQTSGTISPNTSEMLVYLEEPTPNCNRFRSFVSAKLALAGSNLHDNWHDSFCPLWVWLLLIYPVLGEWKVFRLCKNCIC